MKVLRGIAPCVVLALVAVATPVRAQQRTEVIRQNDVFIPMRDGLRLHTEVYRPARDGQPIDSMFPVLLLRTPYELRGEEIVRQAQAFARAGYVVALQNIRGRYRSEGPFTKYADVDGRDGYDTIEWLARQPWSNGRIGTWGRSYAAHAQADAAKLAPPHLCAMIVNQGGMADAWDHAVRHGGAFELGRELTWVWQEARRESADTVAQRLLEREKVEDWYTRLPLRRGLSPLASAPEYEAYFMDEWEHADDGPFWARSALRWKTHYKQTADVPMLHIGGWYDIFLRGTIDNYLGLRSGRRSPVQLLIGPWVHGGNGRTWAGEVDFGPDAAIAGFDTTFHLAWLDRHLKGDTTAPQPPPVRVFVMGGGTGRRNAEGRLDHGGRWVSAETWPLPTTRLTRYYLHPNGALRPSAPDRFGGATTFRFDPAHPVPTLGGHVSARLRDGAWDQRERPEFPGSRAPWLPLSARPDVLVFQTEPLTEDVEMVGPIEVVLHVTTSGRDTDFTVKLIDVHPPNADYPGGFAMNITDAVQRLSYRDGRRTRALAVPNRLYRITVRPFPAANRFLKGHRIRIDISSSNFPRFDVNPGTGEDPARHRGGVTVVNTVFHQAIRPSHVVLPVIPR